VALDVLGTQTGQDADGTGTGVLRQCTRNDFHGIGHSLVRPLLNTFDGASQLAELHGDSHLDGTTAGGQARVEDNVAGNGHGVLQVALDFVQDILGRATQQDGTGLRGLALAHECEVLVTNLLNLEQTAAGTDVGLLDIVDAVDDGGTGGTSNTVVIRLAHTAKGGDVGLNQVVLCEIYKQSGVKS